MAQMPCFNALLLSPNFIWQPELLCLSGVVRQEVLALQSGLRKIG